MECYIPLKIRSFVGLIPLFATMALEPDMLAHLPRFRRRIEWFIKYRTHLIDQRVLVDGARRARALPTGDYRSPGV